MARTLVFMMVIMVGMISCKKDRLLTDPKVRLEYSTDTVFFDTVFTTIGSITERLKIYNPYDQPVEIERIWLKNGSGSNFKLNVDGLAGKVVEDIRIEAEDSIFVFIEVTVDPNGGTTPLVIEDQMLVSINGNSQNVDLIAWGQDAYFWPSYAFQFPGDSVALFTDKPNVFYGYSLVDSATTLVIPEGAQIHFHSGSGLIVGTQASLKVRGTADNPVVIQGDRLEDYFKDVAGQWDQIVFTQESRDNEINHAIIKNGSIGLSVGYTLNPNITERPSVKLRNTQILNMSYIGLIGIDAEIDAQNTVVANCGDHTMAIVLGGDYDFKHCTFANYWSANPRSKAILLLTNFSESTEGDIFRRDLNARFSNSIIHGALDSELQRERVNGADFNYVFDQVIMKLDTEDISNVDRFIGIYKNPLASDTLFSDVPNDDYSLNSSSAAIDKGKKLNVLYDLKGDLRDEFPDLGAYEYKP